MIAFQLTPWEYIGNQVRREDDIFLKSKQMVNWSLLEPFEVVPSAMRILCQREGIRSELCSPRAKFGNFGMPNKQARKASVGISEKLRSCRITVSSVIIMYVIHKWNS